MNRSSDATRIQRRHPKLNSNKFTVKNGFIAEKDIVLAENGNKRQIGD